MKEHMEETTKGMFTHLHTELLLIKTFDGEMQVGYVKKKVFEMDFKMKCIVYFPYCISFIYTLHAGVFTRV